MNNQNNDFLPEGYEQPKGNTNYLKFEKGENKFRILSKPIIGWLDWENKKPLRFQMDEKPEKPIDPTKAIKHFWAFIVWDYKTMSIKILEITQASIQGAIKDLSNNSDWGAPYGYDIKVNRSGDGMETEYSVMPSPHKVLPNEVSDAFNKKACDLDLLFEGKDPFAPSGKVTPMEIPF